MLEVKDLAKSFGSKTVLDGVSFAVSPGRLTALVGGKRSGKSTILQIVAGLLEADGGQVLLDGEELPATREAKRARGSAPRANIGYLPQRHGLYPQMKVAEQLVYLSRLHGMSLGASEQNTDTLLERFELGDRAYTRLGHLTGGEQQRVHIAAALVHDPDVVLLDEPFTDLDPISSRLVFGLLADHAGSGVPILFASAHEDLAADNADEVLTVSGGRVEPGVPGRRGAAASADEDPASGSRYELRTDSGTGWLDDIEGLEVLGRNDGTAVFEVEDAAVAQEALSQAIGRGEVKKFAPAGKASAESLREVV